MWLLLGWWKRLVQVSGLGVLSNSVCVPVCIRVWRWPSGIRLNRRWLRKPAPPYTRGWVYWRPLREKEEQQETPKPPPPHLPNDLSPCSCVSFRLQPLGADRAWPKPLSCRKQLGSGFIATVSFFRWECLSVVQRLTQYSHPYKYSYSVIRREFCVCVCVRARIKALL